MIVFALWHQLRLRNLVRSSSHLPIRDFYKSQMPLLNKSLNATELLAIDLEMTGLLVDKDHVISIGWVPIIKREIHIHYACHYLINSSHEVGESATIHNIMDSEKAQGLLIEQVCDMLIEACHNRIPVFHCAPIDLPFIDKITKGLYSTAFGPAVIDTMALEQKRLLHTSSITGDNDLRLMQCRSRYHLPAYQGHNAMTDALATAELLLAITSDSKDIKVASLL